MRLKTAVPMMLLLLLCACGAAKESAQTPVSFRTALTSAGQCNFTLELTADYGDYIREFTLQCSGDVDGDTSLTVMAPEIAQGVTATVSGEDAAVSYSDTVLAVENFESRAISPMAAPYLLTKAWSEGYIESCGVDGDWEQVHYLLGYGGKQLEIVTCFAGQEPQWAEISDGENILISCEISEFTLQKKAEQHDENQEDAETDMGRGESGQPGA